MNRSTIKKKLYHLSKPISVHQLANITNQRLIFPFYHAVSNHLPAHLKHIINVPTEKRFIDDIEFLLRNFEPATLEEVLTFNNQNWKNGKPKFYLTFDDGFSECYYMIAPILEKYGLEATFFINPNFIDNQAFSHRLKVSLLIEKLKNNKGDENILKKQFQADNQKEVIHKLRKLTIQDFKIINELERTLDLNFADELKHHQPYLNKEQLHSLQDRGFTIGSHSLSHPEFHLINVEAQMKEIFNSFQQLDKLINIEPRLFSFPFSDDGVPNSVFDYLHNELKVKASFGTAGLKNDSCPNHFHRIAMEDVNFDSAQQIIQSEYIYYLAKGIFGKNMKSRN